jgi:hypothetical protein
MFRFKHIDIPSFPIFEAVATTLYFNQFRTI